MQRANLSLCVTAVLVLLAATAPLCVSAVTTQWIASAPTSSWFSPQNWNNGVPGPNDDVILGPLPTLQQYVVVVNGTAACRTLSVISQGQQFAPTIAVTGRLTIQLLNYASTQNSFFSFLLDANSVLNVTSRYTWTIDNPASDASFAVFANASTAYCEMNSITLNGGTLVSAGGLLPECRILSDITTQSPAPPRQVALANLYTPGPSGPVFAFLGQYAPLLLGSHVLEGSWYVGQGGLGVQMLEVPVGSGGFVRIGNASVGTVTVRTRIRFSSPVAQSVPNQLRFADSAIFDITSATMTLNGGLVATGALALRGSSAARLIISPAGPLLFNGTLATTDLTMEIQGPRSLTLVYGFAFPSLVISRGPVTMSSPSAQVQNSFGFAPVVIQQGGALVFSGTSSFDQFQASGIDVSGLLSVTGGSVIASSVTVQNYAAVFVASGALLNVNGGTFRTQGSFSLVQVGIASTSSNVVIKAGTGLLNGGELNIVVSSSLTWTTQTIWLITASSGSGQFSQLTGFPRDGAVYSIVYDSLPVWKQVGVSRFPTNQTSPPIACGPGVCGAGANCQNCPYCGRDPTGNSYCCNGTAPFCLYEEFTGLCAAAGCPLGPSTTSTTSTVTATTAPPSTTTTSAVTLTSGTTQTGQTTNTKTTTSAVTLTSGTTQTGQTTSTTKTTTSAVTLTSGTTSTGQTTSTSATTTPTAQTTTTTTSAVTLTSGPTSSAQSTTPTSTTTTSATSSPTTTSSTTSTSRTLTTVITLTSASTSSGSTASSTTTSTTTRAPTTTTSSTQVSTSTTPTTKSTTATTTTSTSTTSAPATTSTTAATTTTTTTPATTTTTTTPATTTTSTKATTTTSSATTSGPSTTSGSGTSTTSGATSVPTTLPTLPPLNPNDIPLLPTQYANSMNVFDGQGTLYWNVIDAPTPARSADGRTVNPVAGTFSAAFVFPIKQGWFGIGLPPFAFLPGDGHVNADMWMFQVDPANPTNVLLTDRWSTQNALPALDTALGGQDNLIFPQGIITSTGLMYVKFRRQFYTGDPFDQTISTTSVQPCLFAFSTLPGLNNHGRANRETQLCNFGNLTIQPAPTKAPNRLSLIVAHGVLGALGVGLFMTFGLWIHRYLWCLPIVGRFVLSSVVLLFGCVLIIISFIIACVMVAQASGEHFSFNTGSKGGHGITALVVMIGAVCFVIMRVMLDCFFHRKHNIVAEDPRSDKALFYRFAWNASWVVAVITVLVGWPSIFLGFVDEYNTYPWLWVIGAILIFVGVVFVVSEIIRLIFAPKEEREVVAETRTDVMVAER